MRERTLRERDYEREDSERERTLRERDYERERL